MSEFDAGHTGSTSMFALFAFSIYTLFLFCVSLYKFCGGADDEVAQPWEKIKGKKPTLSKRLQKYLTKEAVKDDKPFDPYEILQIDRGATEKEIKQAYRALSRKFHPDKNPDPKAAQFFAEFLTKAYQALTDPVARENYEKYGHPDGPQATDLGVALPEWMFSKDRRAAPILLFGLVGGGILLPLSLVSWFMLRSNKFAGPNRIINETLQIYFYSKQNVKESQSLVRIPETLVCAMEFIMLPTPPDHTLPMDELRKLVLRHQPDLKEKTPFWKRKASVVKVHMLLMAHLEREGDSVPPLLQADLKFVLQKAPLLLEEMFKIAVLPRPPSMAYGWWTPAVATIEMMQCVAQAVSINVRKPSGGKGVDTTAPLLQLPHCDGETLKKLKRKRVSSIKELQELPEEERLSVLQSCGLSEAQAEDANTLLVALPTVYVRAHCQASEGEEEIMESDVVTCKMRVMLTRPSHKSSAFEPKGKVVRAFTPSYPFPLEEGWWIIIGDPANNSVLTSMKVTLMEAEVAGHSNPQAALDLMNTSTDNGRAPSESSAVVPAGKKSANGKEAATSEEGQEVNLIFRAPKAGRHNLEISLMSDCYIGCDRTLKLSLRVAPLTRAAAEGRDARSLARAKAAEKKWEDDDDEEEEAKAKKKQAAKRIKEAPVEDGEGATGDEEGGEEEEGEDDEGEEEEEEEEDYDYDSEETGEDVTDDEGEATREGTGETAAPAAATTTTTTDGEKKEN